MLLATGNKVRFVQNNSSNSKNNNNNNTNQKHLAKSTVCQKAPTLSQLGSAFFGIIFVCVFERPLQAHGGRRVGGASVLKSLKLFCGSASVLS